MTGTATSPIRDLERRATGNALLAVAFAALLLVPLPAVLVARGTSAPSAGVASVLAVLGALVTATPAFALGPFVFGCGIGTLAHLALTARQRFADLEAGRHVDLGGRSLVACSLLVGGLFAATGLVGAIVLFGVA